MKTLVERQFTPYLGQANRAELLINWSMKQRPGNYYSKQLAVGLTLHFRANRNEPKVYLHWNPQRHQQFLTQLGATDKLWLTNYGVCVSRDAGVTTVRLLGAGKSSIELWHDRRDFCQKHNQDNVDWLLGMLKFAEDGPLFYSQVECQKELEQITPLVLGETKQLAKLLPHKNKQPRELSERSRAWLLADAITGAILKEASLKAR
jgi:hypothetical protein